MIIGSPPDPRAPRSLVHRLSAGVGPASRPLAQPASTAVGGSDVAARAWSRSGLIQAADQPRLVAAAMVVAGLAVRPDVSERLLAGFRMALERNPRVLPMRLARLLAELERQGIPADPVLVDLFLARDGFGAGGVAGPGSRGSGGQGTSDDHDSRKHPQAAAEVEFSGEAGSGDSLGLDGSTLAARPGPGDWTWVSLPVRDWNQGGSLRFRSGQSGQEIAMDIATAQGPWQFYWTEPDRGVLHFLPPESREGGGRWAAETVPVLPEALATGLESSLGGMGFVTFRLIHDADWIDGFNFFESTSILKHVDVVA